MSDATPTDTELAAFVTTARPHLLDALVATYGPVDERDATAGAFSWAWEHWDRITTIANPFAYLYRVGQNATRRSNSRAEASASRQRTRRHP